MSDVEDPPLFAVENLNAFYGSARALEDVSFEMRKESIAIIGRNGMGKTTLCNAIMNITPPHASGSIRFRGEQLVGKPSHAVASRGIGYVPQGRRLFPSLSVDEHLRMIRPARTVAGDGRNWTIDGVYELFPRLAERKKNGGAQLSGGEQQMLAIGRAMLTNPLLLIMDEPSEGLAPAIVEHLIGVFRSLEESGLAIILIEQNLSVATAIARRQLVMVAGRIFTETTAEELVNDPEAQRRFLGVEPLQQHEV
jgi:branched-chain amino acid transport system ATP-binding protein